MTPEEMQQLASAPRTLGNVLAQDASPVTRFLMTYRVEAVSILACLGLLLLVFELVRRRQIKEKYSLLWFATGVSLLVLTLKRDWLAALAATIGVYYPPTALFLVLSFFMILILVHFSMVLTRLLSQNNILAQQLALLEAELEELRQKGAGHGPDEHPGE
jgi:hypothetical protein